MLQYFNNNFFCACFINYLTNQIFIYIYIYIVDKTHYSTSCNAMKTQWLYLYLCYVQKELYNRMLQLYCGLGVLKHWVTGVCVCVCVGELSWDTAWISWRSRFLCRLILRETQPWTCSDKPSCTSRWAGSPTRWQTSALNLPSLSSVRDWGS